MEAVPDACAICGATVAIADAAHVMCNDPDAEGVADYYVCPSCFRSDVAPLFDGAESEHGVVGGSESVGPDGPSVGTEE